MVKVKAGIIGELTVDSIKKQIAFEGGEIPGGDYELEGRTEGVTVGEFLSLFPGNLEQVIPEFIADIALNRLEIIYDYIGQDNQGNKLYDTYYNFKISIDEINIQLGLKVETELNKKSLFLIINNPDNPSQPYLFNLYFSNSQAASSFIAIYSRPEAPLVPIKTFVESISSQIASYIPVSLALKISNVIFAYTQENNNSKFLFGLDIGGSINLSDLPLVGQKFPSDRTVLVAGLRLLIASENFLKTETQDQIQPLNQLLPPSFAPLPPNGINKGVNVAAQINFGSEVELLDLSLIELPEEAPEPPEEPETSPTPPAAIAPTEDKVQWFNIQKTFGPVDLQRVGVQYKDEVIWFLLDASLSVAGLTITLDGAAVGSPLTEFKPRFKLQGLGIDYAGDGALTIGGAFLKSQVEYNGKLIDVYSGAVVIKTEELGITGLGSYMEIDGHPSLFVYAVLDQPLGGPAFFFVTGLALGFGYNRTLVVPTLEGIPTFPLVQAAIKPTATGKPKDAIAIVSLLKGLQTSLPPRVGHIVLAVGIKFTSFKIIDSFALLVAAFGDRFALYLLGTSVLVAPPRVSQKLDKALPPLAQVRFALIARFIPAEGILQVEGKILPGSYIFTPDCRLTGGFAFYSWFSGRYAGDFVLTVGGYHPAFKVPAHYPNVDRLGLNWQITPQLSIKGNVYFALTASALMAGGRLEAVWKSGSLKAWFIAEAHFLIAWRPYFYDVRIAVNIGASYTFKILGIRKTISIDVGADLHIWGPEFSGTATVNLSIVSFTVRFGNNAPSTPPPLNWADFKTSFLPANAEVCAIGVQSGLLRSFTGKNQQEISVVNPSDFSLSTSSTIPIKQSNVAQSEILAAAFGIAPMNLESGGLLTTYKLIVTYRSLATNQEQDITTQFNYKVINKQMPIALWGQSQKPQLNGTKFINLSSGIEVSPKTASPGGNLSSGIEVSPKTDPPCAKTQTINQSVLRYDTDSAANSYNWQSFSRFQTSAQADEQLRGEAIRNSIIQKTVQRRELLSHLGFSDAEINGIDLTELTADINQAFEIIPQLEAIAP